MKPNPNQSLLHFSLSIAVAALWLAVSPSIVLGQSNRKPPRVKPPKLDSGTADSVFFDDIKSLLKGELPSSQSKITRPAPSDQPGESGESPGSEDPRAWNKLVSPTSLEDLIKGSKLRLEKIVTTPTAFAGGGFAVARKEFSLLALLFAIIEKHPDDVRWKESASIAREVMTRSAANTKVGSIQSYQEAKKRLLDLGDLVNGTKLVGESRSEIDWSNLIDRTPLMQLLEWAEEEHVARYSASESEFASNKDALLRYSEMIAILGKATLQEDMPDANDEDYQELANKMIDHALQIRLAVETDNAAMARQAAGSLGQSCTNCHDDFR